MLTLGVIAKHGTQSFQQLLYDALPHVSDVIVMLDDDPEPGINKFIHPRVHYFHRSLGLDFSAQRNAVMGLVKTDWCLHLDTDENLSPWLWSNLMTLFQPTVDLVWMPRSNFIEGYDESDMLGWPDWQPRLMRKHVRWHLPMHETPVNLESLRQYKLPEDRKYAVIHRKTLKDWQKASQLYAEIKESNDQ